MKLIKPFNQLRSILPSAVGGSAYRFLSIFMAAILFCGMNSQIMAADAATIPGANNDPNNNAAVSGDRFNSESFLKASNPNADANQHWTVGEEIGAGIVGIALLGGIVAGGYKYYIDRNAEATRQAKEEVSKSKTDPANVSSGSAATEDEQRDEGMSKAKDSTAAPGNVANADAGTTPGWGTKIGDLFTACGKGAYDLATLKSCWPAKEVAEKSPMELLNDAYQIFLKAKQAEAIKNRTYSQFGYQLITLQSQDPLMERQQKDKAMEARGNKPQGQLTLNEHKEWQKYDENLDRRKAAIAALTPESSVRDMYAVLDPETKAELDKITKGEINVDNKEDKNIDKKVKLLYLVATNPNIHPEHLIALQSDHIPVEIKNKVDAVIDKHWEAAEAAIKAKQGAQGGGDDRLPALENADGATDKNNQGDKI